MAAGVALVPSTLDHATAFERATMSAFVDRLTLNSAPSSPWLAEHALFRPVVLARMVMAIQNAWENAPGRAGADDQVVELVGEGQPGQCASGAAGSIAGSPTA
ncbi:hypothetical protein [Lacisediminihabitans profunda]|uniref:Uncharacterized protein n=1 Tax=Lacisediminihabitans profunda TaxID=2594790 RepID=A0A5C8ULY5_9MICO|nr:hypothetical protein [Lacisediminihabitans profunda]TXN28362.1 hypothetical protein FVP33_18010 [Lacisediminihabitans profunda]